MLVVYDPVRGVDEGVHETCVPRTPFHAPLRETLADCVPALRHVYAAANRRPALLARRFWSSKAHASSRTAPAFFSWCSRLQTITSPVVMSFRIRVDVGTILYSVQERWSLGARLLEG
jgi:hypothetical protein